jgi:hypothetical protein
MKNMFCQQVTPDLVLNMKSPSEGFLCQVSANTYDINFKSFRISNYTTKETLFDTECDQTKIDLDDISFPDVDAFRSIRYSFKEEMLKIPSIATW